MGGFSSSASSGGGLLSGVMTGQYLYTHVDKTIHWGPEKALGQSHRMPREWGGGGAGGTERSPATQLPHLQVGIIIRPTLGVY